MPSGSRWWNKNITSRYFCSYNANYRNEGLSAFLFYCDEKRKADRKEKHAIHNNAFGIVTPSDISI